MKIRKCDGFTSLSFFWKSHFSVAEMKSGSPLELRPDGKIYKARNPQERVFRLQVISRRSIWLSAIWGGKRFFNPQSWLKTFRNLPFSPFWNLAWKSENAMVLHLFHFFENRIFLCLKNSGKCSRRQHKQKPNLGNALVVNISKNQTWEMLSSSTWAKKSLGKPITRFFGKYTLKILVNFENPEKIQKCSELIKWILRTFFSSRAMMLFCEKNRCCFSAKISKSYLFAQRGNEILSGEGRNRTSGTEAGFNLPSFFRKSQDLKLYLQPVEIPGP